MNLPHRIILTPVTAGRDAMGAPTEVLGTPIDAWADVSEAGDSTSWRYQHHETRPSHSVTIRYREAVKPRWRLEWRDRHFDVLDVRADTERSLQRLQIKERGT